MYGQTQLERGRLKIRYVIMSFFYLFFFKFVNIPFVSVLDTTIIVGMILIVSYLLSEQMRRTFGRLIADHKVGMIVGGCILLIVAACIITLVHGEFDFTICSPLFHQLIFLIVGLEYYSYLSSKSQAKNIIYYIVIAYCLQTIIQYLSFLSPAFHSFTNWFKTDYQIDNQRFYSGFRLNAISGGLAFSLAAGYAVVTTVFIIRWKELTAWNDAVKSVVLVLLFAGGLSAGRTAILLDLIAIACLLIRKVKNFNLKIRISKSLLFLIILSPFILLGTYYIANVYISNNARIQESLATVWHWLSKWDVYFNPNNESGYYFWEDMFSKIPNPLSLIIGDGRYTELDGANYLHQDAGYVRILAFGGIPWLIFLYLYQRKFFVNPRMRKFENTILLMIILIGTLKADFLGILLQSQLIIFQIFLLNNDESKSVTGGIIEDE